MTSVDTDTWEREIGGPASPWWVGMGDLWQKQFKWAQETFGPERRDEGLFDHLDEEVAELKEKPDDIFEAVDILFLVAHHAMMVLASYGDPQPGLTLEAFWLAKFNKNKRREWPDWRTADPTKAIKHVKGIND